MWAADLRGAKCVPLFPANGQLGPAVLCPMAKRAFRSHNFAAG